MSKRNDEKQRIRETAEYVYYLILPLLCAAALLRSCGAGKREQTPETQQTVAVQQVMANDRGATKSSAQIGETAGRTEQTAAGAETIAVRQNPFDPEKFVRSEETGQIYYDDENYESLQGIDVSDHQGEIDWDAVADAGYTFVFVRVGFRGYGQEGTLNEDTMAIEYLQDAEKAGLQVGAYFFSQAVSEEEAAEEARFSADVIKRSGVKLDLPLVYDPELAGGSVGRANDLTREQVSANAAAFRDAAESAMHCKVAIYTNLFWENTYFDVETLNDFEIWYADYEETPQTNCHFSWWQYTESGTVPGIRGNMDLNLWIRRID